MFALVAAIMFIVAAVKLDTASSPVFWLYLGLAAWSLHFFIDPWLSPYYPARRAARNVP